MLAFITTLRHPRNSSDYGRVERLFGEMLASVTSQTSDAYVVIVVGNERPRIALPRRAEFVPVDFPAPSSHRGPRTPVEASIWDKGTKLGVGLAASRKYEPDYVMLCDADDFVHRDLARYARSHHGSSGWVIDRGFVFSRRRNVYRRQSNFNRLCGTSHIVSFEAFAVPDWLSTRSSQKDVERALGERLWRTLGAHMQAKEWFHEHGVVLESLPFPGAVYQVDTGENHSRNELRGIAMPITSALRDAFTLPATRAMRDFYTAFGPRAIAESAYLSAMAPLRGVMSTRTSVLSR